MLGPLYFGDSLQFLAAAEAPPDAFSVAVSDGGVAPALDPHVFPERGQLPGPFVVLRQWFVFFSHLGLHFQGQ